MTPLRWFGMGFAACLALIGLGLIAYSYYGASAPATLSQPAKELTNAQTETKQCAAIVVYRDAKTKKNLGLPQEVVRDAARSVVAATQIAGDDRPHTVSAVYDQATGKVAQFDRPDPLPWLDTRQRFGVGVGYGMGSEHDRPVGKLDGYWQPFKLKALTFRVTGDLTGDGQWSAFGRIGMDW